LARLNESSIKVKKSKQENEQEIIRALKTLTTADKLDFPGLQIADVVAYNAFQHVTRRPFPTTALLPDNPANYMTEAKKRQRVPILHMRMGTPELQRFKQFILDEVKERRKNSGSQRDLPRSVTTADRGGIALSAARDRE
jgi:hypothetical protein